MLEQLQAQLESFKYHEKGALTDEELATLREMFSVKGGFAALFKFMCMIESEKGVQMSYDIEGIQTTMDGVKAEESDAEIQVKKTITRYVRFKLESARVMFQDEIEKEIQTLQDERDKKRAETEEEIKELEQEIEGVGEQL